MPLSFTLVSLRSRLFPGTECLSRSSRNRASISCTSQGSTPTKNSSKLPTLPWTGPATIVTKTSRCFVEEIVLCGLSKILHFLHELSRYTLNFSHLAIDLYKTFTPRVSHSTHHLPFTRISCFITLPLVFYPSTSWNNHMSLFSL